MRKHISRKGIARPQSQFPHSCVCAVCLFCCREICGPILGIYKSLADTGMWKLGLRLCNSFSMKHKRDFRCNTIQKYFLSEHALFDLKRLCKDKLGKVLLKSKCLCGCSKYMWCCLLCVCVDLCCNLGLYVAEQP